MKASIAIALLIAALITLGCTLPNGNGNTPPVTVGNDSDAHGCIGSAGYTWCEEKQKCIRLWEENCTAQILGNDRDAHGCIGSAGYTWCESSQKCIRSWEENCTGAIACTAEAKICPDGSAVGRQGPNCEFVTCPSSTPLPPGNYSFYGKISIGPLCPVEPCNRTFDYSQVRVNVYDAASKNLVAQANADSGGYYGIKLEQGSYLVNVTDAAGNSFGLPRLDYTQPISIEQGKKIEMDFKIDTGIR